MNSIIYLPQILNENLSVFKGQVNFRKIVPYKIVICTNSFMLEKIGQVKFRMLKFKLLT